MGGVLQLAQLPICGLGTWFLILILTLARMTFGFGTGGMDTDVNLSNYRKFYIIIIVSRHVSLLIEFR
jgi:hypothetical protein